MGRLGLDPVQGGFQFMSLKSSKKSPEGVGKS